MNRYWEIDAARTLAIGMMVAYHLAWDLWWLTPDIDIDPFGGWLRALQVCTGSSFLFITGVSAALVHQRMVAAGVPMATRLRRHWRRALQVLAAGALVTVATFVALGSEDYVRFGILQCIGTVMLLLPLLARLGPVLNVAFAVPVILVGLQLRTAVSDVPGALIIAWRLPGGTGVDHYPLLPWLGPAMLGLAAGMLLYPGGHRHAVVERLVGRIRGAVRATWPGRHALPIYLVHQIVLIGLTALALQLAGVTVDPGQR